MHTVGVFKPLLLKKVTSVDLHKAVNGTTPVESLDDESLIRLQFVKLVNYYRYELDSKFGGFINRDSFETEASCDIEVGFRRFKRFVNNREGVWIKRKVTSHFWIPENMEVTTTPKSRELGRPYEAYLAAGGSVLTLDAAKQVLGVDKSELLDLKLSHCLDSLVIAECLRRMLKPRPLW